jgi:hypothetical protein
MLTLPIAYKKSGSNMKAIEIETTANDKGKIEVQLSDNYINKKVRIIILSEDAFEEEEWLHAITENPAFDFLNEPSENIYSLKDGKPYRP